MGRIQSSIGLITGTDIAGTVDQLIAISGAPRDRLVARTNTLFEEQTALAELTASVIGVQLAGKQLSSASIFRSRETSSSDSETLSAAAGNNTTPATHVVRTLRTAATHDVSSLQRYEDAEADLNFVGTLSIAPTGGFLDESANLTDLNGGRGVELGTIRITDRGGASAEIDLTEAKTVDDVLAAINDANIEVKATTSGNAFVLTDTSGSTASNLVVQQLGSQETAADLGLWGIDDAANSVTGNDIDLAAGVSALRGVALTELGGGSGIGPLTDLDITLSDGSSASIDLSSANTTAEVIDLIDAAGLDLIVKLNDARNGLQLRDVSGGTGSFDISSVDTTAADLGIATSTTEDIVVGENLARQSVTSDTLIADLNQGSGPTSGSFTITDRAGITGAVNLVTDNVKTVGDLVDAINDISADVTAAINESGDGIHIIDNSTGSGTLTVEDSGSGTAAAQLGIAGTATTQTIGGNSESAIVGSQSIRIDVAADDSLTDIAAKINAADQYADAAVALNDDGSYSLNVRSRKGGEDGRLAINTSGFDLDLRTTSRGQDALIAVSTDNGIERFLSSSDGVFTLDDDGSTLNTISGETALADLNRGRGIDGGSFTITDSSGAISAINITAEGITTVDELISAFNNLSIGVTASINDSGDGIAIVDNAGGSGKLTITDTGSGTAAADLGVAGEATTQSVGGFNVSALVGPAEDELASEAGLTLTLKQLSTDPITVSVSENPDAVVSAANSFVDQFNSLVDKLDSLTFFNGDTNEVGLLFGSSEALRIENSYNRLLSGRIQGAGNLESIGQVGLRFNDKGKLDLDESKLSETLSESPGAVEAFFTTEEYGLAQRLDVLAERIAGESNSLLIGRTESLTTQIERNNERIDTLNLRLENERERLLKQFYSTESAIAKITSNQQYLSAIKPVSIPS